MSWGIDVGRGRRRRPAFVVCVLALALVASGCGVGEFRERRQQAEHVMDTPDRLRAAGTARFSMQQLFRPIEMRDASLEFFPFPVPLDGEMDFTTDRVELTLTGEIPSPEALGLEGLDQGALGALGEGSAALEAAAQASAGMPVMVYDDMRAYFRRLADPEDAREWARFDLDAVEDAEADVPLLGFSPVNPVVWLHLLAGALTGSVQRIGQEEVRGVPTTRYEANLDREKAFRDLPEDRSEELEDLFRMMRAASIVVPAEIWLDGDGLPRRATYEVEQRPSRHDGFELLVTIELYDFGTPVDIALPGPDETVEVAGLVQLVREVGIG